MLSVVLTWRSMNESSQWCANCELGSVEIRVGRLDYLIVRVVIGLAVVIAHERGENGLFLVHLSNSEVDFLYCFIGSIHDHDSAAHVEAERLGD